MNNSKWSIGEVDIFQIVELEENEIFSSFIPEAKRENIKKISWLYPNFADERGELKALVQSFLIKSNGKNILIDTCNGNGKNRPNVKKWSNLNTDYLGKFDSVKVKPEEIDFVACTHLHFDHVGWNTKRENGEYQPTFPNAKYIFSKQEYDYWIKKPEKEMIDDFNGIDDSVSPIINAGLAQFIDDDYKLDNQISFFSTPGHTPHHISVKIESRGKTAIITGDIMHHPCQIAKPDWTTGADTNPEQTVKTRKKFLQEVKDKDILVIGTHFSNPVAGKVKQLGNEFIFEV